MFIIKQEKCKKWQRKSEKASCFCFFEWEGKGKPYQKNHPQPSQGQAQGWCVGALR